VPLAVEPPPSGVFAVIDTVPLITAVPVHVVALDPFAEVTVFVPSVNCQLLKIAPVGPEAVHVVLFPRVTLVQETCSTFPVPVPCVGANGQAKRWSCPWPVGILVALAWISVEPTATPVAE